MADNMEKINCPACGEEMIKVFMPIQGVNIDVCVNGCGGIYFDNREFSKFDTPNDDITPLLEVFKNKEFKKTDETQTRQCPVCKSNMVKNFTNENHEIEVDECYTCGGKFLDYKELDKIRAQYSSGETITADIMKKLYENAGIKPITAVDYQKIDNEWKKGAFQGALFGLLIAIFFLYKSKDVLSGLADTTATLSAGAIAIGICLCFAGIGALFAKLNNKN